MSQWRNNMKTLVIYTSQTGFTKKYAELLGSRLNAEVVDLKKVKKAPSSRFADADAIIFGGWVIAGKVFGSDWFTPKIAEWQGKKLAMFAVGGFPCEYPETEAVLQNALTEEQKKHVKVFYCQGGMCFEKMRFPYKLIMKMMRKTAAQNLNASEKDKEMAEMLSKSYDSSDAKYIGPIVEYIAG